MDFDSLVLGPCMDAFAEPITIDPVVSQPGALPYGTGRASFFSQSYEVPLQDGSVVADQKTWIGFRLSEFAIPPTGGDLVTVGGQVGSPPSRATPVQYVGVDFHVDGQGGATMTLRKTTPARTTALPGPYAWPTAANLAGNSTLSAG